MRGNREAGAKNQERQKDGRETKNEALASHDREALLNKGGAVNVGKQLDSRVGDTS